MSDPAQPVDGVPLPGVHDLLIQRVNAELTPERIQERVDKALDKILDRAIDEALNSWSDTGKSIKAALTGSLRVTELDLPGYGHVVCQILERQVQAKVSEAIADRLTQDMADLLKLAPKEVKLSEIVAEILGDDDDPCACDGPSEVYLEIEWEDDRTLVWMYLSKEKPRSKHDADMRLLVKLEHPYGQEPRPEGMESWRKPDPRATISSGWVKGSDLKKDTRFGWGTDYSKQKTEFGRWFGLEQKILAYYACGTVLILDEDACVLSRYDH